MNALKRLSMEKRVEWVDFAKGIAILLVIVGHNGGNVIRGAVYSFHMPLFFLLSCVTFKYSTNDSDFVKRTERAFKHLLAPTLVLLIINLLFGIVGNFHSFNSITNIISFIRSKLLMVIFCSGVEVSINDITIEPIGLPWFMVALFLGRTIFDYMNYKYTNKKVIILCLLCTLVGVIFGQIQWLPLSFDIVLALFPFFYIGKSISVFKISNKPFSKLIIYAFSWAILMFVSFFSVHDYLEFAYRRYPLFPFCYFIALLGILMMIEFSILVCKCPHFSLPMRYLGKNSVYMLYIHAIDYSLLRPLWEHTTNIYINGFIRICVDLVFFIALMIVIEKIRTYRSKTK